MRRVMDGAAGFVTKSGLSSELLSVVRLVLAGGVYRPADGVSEWVGTAGRQRHRWSGARAANPSPGNWCCLNCWMGAPTARSAPSFISSEETVKNHVTAILRRFDVQTRTCVVLAAERHGYVAGSRSAASWIGRRGVLKRTAPKPYPPGEASLGPGATSLRNRPRSLAGRMGLEQQRQTGLVTGESTSTGVAAHQAGWHWATDG
ncbi:MAG: response regulator transcription factor [Rhodoferax sp.]|nr:response regulator transcription factor [Rhodoferax sp.]